MLKKNLKILIFGGTGVMGSALVELLKGHELHVTSRQNMTPKDGERIIYHTGNAKNIDFIKAIIDKYGKMDAIVDFMTYSIAEFKDRIEMLLSFTEQYVFMSSARVFADSCEPITEDSPKLLDVSADLEYLNTDEYALAKAREEKLLKDAKKSNWTIVRPYITYGSRRLQLGVLEKENWLYRCLKGRSIVFSNDIASKYTTMTMGNDVAEGIAALIGNRSALEEDFNITNNQPYIWANIFNVYLEVLEKRLGYRPNVIMADKSPNLQMGIKKYQVIYDRYYNRVFDNSKIGKLIDVHLFADAMDGVKKCLNDFLDEPKFRDIDWIIEAMLDRESNETTRIKEIKSLKTGINYFAYRYDKVDCLQRCLKLKRNLHI